MRRALTLMAVVGLGLAACTEGPTVVRPDLSPLLNATGDPELPTYSTIVDGPQTFPLVAAQDMEVGYIEISNDADYLYVKFVVTETEWCLTETHVAYGTDLAEIPQTKKYNPIPGQFPYSRDLSCVSEHTTPPLELPAGWSAGDDLYVAAHAVVLSYFNDGDAILYGIDRQTGVETAYDSDLYRINATTGDETEIFDVTDNSPGFQNAPNGLGYDGAGNWYWGDYAGPTAAETTVYRYDGANQLSIATVTGATSGAAVHGGYYYYGAQETNEVRRVAVTGGADELVCELPEVFGWGDFVITPDGSTMYHSTRGRGDPRSNDSFFMLDLPSCAYTLIADSETAGGPYALGMQLAWGSDGTLYAVDTGGQALYSVDLATGATAFIADLHFEHTDIASGFAPRYETAWAGDMECADQDDRNPYGCDFDGKNWATYVVYTGQSQVVYTCPAPTALAHVDWISAPDDVTKNALVDPDVQLFAESVGVLGAAQVVEIPYATPLTEVAAETPYCSYYAHLDANTTNVRYPGYVTFDAAPFGLIVSGSAYPGGGLFAGDDLLCQTHGVFGAAGTLYPTPCVGSGATYSGLELQGEAWPAGGPGGSNDAIRVTGSTVEFDLVIGTAYHDAFRILLPAVEDGS